MLITAPIAAQFVAGVTLISRFTPTALTDVTLEFTPMALTLSIIVVVPLV